MYVLMTFPCIQVNGFPTLHLYKDGKKVEEFSGKRTIEALEAFINKHRTKKDEL